MPGTRGDCTVKEHKPDCPMRNCACTCGFDDYMDREIVRLTNAFLGWLGRHSSHTLAVSEADGVFALMAVNDAGNRVNEAGEQISIATTPVVLMVTPVAEGTDMGEQFEGPAKPEEPSQ